jgi:peptidoglycan/LPS O-acetylase OafA/YrhL
LNFRNDIQILRGIAVLLVVLFHLNLKLFNSGFLGVDIFFVISGFLMAILYDPTDKSKFYIRRIKRLLPAYFATIILTLIASLFIIELAEFRQLKEQSFFAIFFSSNIGFWMQNSYFSKSDFNPLLHLWSLGVEIQFYLIVPLLYWFYKKFKLLFFMIILFSLVGCLVLVQVSPKTAFFMMPFRLWEFLIGFYIAKVLTDNGNVKYSKYPNIGLIALIFLILIPIIPIDGQLQSMIYGHPGLIALCVGILTGFILAFGLPSKVTNSTIGKTLTFLGKYSYSIYLVHFPLIVLYLYKPFLGTILDINSFYDVVILVLLLILITSIFYKLFEEEFQKQNKINLKIFILFIFTFTFILLSTFLKQNQYSNKEKNIFDALEDRAFYRCGKINRILNPSSPVCDMAEDKDNTNKKVMLLGNSHADSIKTSFNKIAKENNINVKFIVQNDPLFKGGLQPEQIIKISKENNLNAIIIHYSKDKLDESFTVENILKLIKLANENSIQTSFIMPVPIWPESVPMMLYKNYAEDFKLPIQIRNDYNKSNEKIFTTFSSIESKNYFFYEIKDIYCKTDCKLINQEDKPLYFDDDHLNLTGAKLMEPLFQKIFNNIYNNKEL